VSAPRFWFDFGSPNAYLAWRVLPGIEARTGVRFQLMPVLIGGIFKRTGNRAPMLAFAQVPAKLAYEALEIRRFVDRHGLREFVMNPHFPVNTLVPMRGAVAAGDLGVFDTYVAAMFRFMWEEPRRLDDPEVLRATWRDAGLPTEALGAAVEEPAIKARLAASTEEAVHLGMFGLPSVTIGDRLWFGKDRLDEVEEALR
jgi:2-hydroxychromene-2-carboxylate isomerase